MKRKIILLTCLVFILSGCGVIVKTERGERKESQKNAEEMGISYDYNNLEISPGYIFDLSGQGSGYTLYFDEEEQPYFYYVNDKLGAAAGEGIDPDLIVKSYYVNWVYNDYIFNEEYENDFLSLMQELEDLGYEYVVAHPGTVDLYENYYPSETVTRSKPTYTKLSEEEWMTSTEFEEYVTGMGDLSEVDWYEFKNDMQYYPIMTIVFDEGQMSDEELQQLEEEMMKYYNEEEMYVEFINKSYEENTFFMDSEAVEEKKATYKGDEPVYYFMD